MSKLFKRVLSVVMVTVMTATLFFSHFSLSEVEVKAAQSLGAGSIATTVNSDDQSYTALLPSLSKQNVTRFTTDNYNNNKAALDTNDWASNWLWDLEGDRTTDSTGALTGTAYAFPLSFLMKKDGLRVTKPSMTSNATNISAYNIKDNDTLGDFNIIPNWTSTLAEVDEITDWSYEAVVENPSNSSQNMRITMTQGSPFTFIELTNSNILTIEKLRVTFPSTIVYSGTYNGCLMYVFRCMDNVSMVNGFPGMTYQYYAAYFPASTTVSSLGTTDTTGNDGIGKLQFTLPSGSTYMSLAWIHESQSTDDSAALAYAQEYRPYAFNFITDTRADYSYNESTSKITTTYKYTVEKKSESTADGTIMGILPHQYKNMSGYSYMSNDAITLRGMMKFMKGSSYQTVMKYDGILPFMPYLPEEDTAGRAQLQSYVDSFMSTYMANKGSWTLAIDEGNETYYHGKKLNRSAQVLAAAKSLGDEDAASEILAALQANLEEWFTYSGASDDNYFSYMANGVGALLGFPTSFNAVDQFNDHHFHYGYFIQSAACVGLWDKSWLEDYKDVVKQLVYDIASPYRNQSDCVADCGNAYPYLRSFSPYEGHSWASGYEDERTGNNQESTSEAINAWAGIILFGELIGDDTIRDLGIYLYTTEVESANNYWFDHDKDIYTIEECKYDAPMASMVWGGKVDYATWFGAEYTQGIQICPMQSWSFYLLKGGKDYIYEFYNYDKTSANASGGSTSLWNDMWAAYYALADPSTAMNSIWTKSTINDGESQAHTYHYIQSMIDYGTPDLSFTSTSPLTTVFEKDGSYTYAVYNASDSAEIVTVTDSKGSSVQLVASPNEMTLFDSDDIGKATYTIEYYGKDLNSNSYSLIDSAVKYADAGTTVTASAKSITGFSYESGNSSNVTSATVNANGTTTLKLYYTRGTYTVSYELNGGTKNNSSLYTTSYTYGQTYSLDTPTREGYSFMGWYKDANFSTKLTSITAKTNGNLTLYARWVLAGTILLNDDVYLEFDSNTNGTFTIIGDQGYKAVNVLYKICTSESEAASEAANKTESGYVAWGMTATSSGWTRTDSFAGNKGQYIVFYFIRYDDNGGYKTDYAYGEIGGTNVSVDTTSQAATTTTTTADSGKISAPQGLTYAGNDALPYYFAWQGVTNAVSYNIYVNNTLAGNTAATAYNIDSSYFTSNGNYIIGVSAVSSSGTESDKTTTIYTVTNGTQETTTTQTPTTTTEELDDGYVACTNDGNVSLGAWGYYVGTWANASAEYKGGTTYDDFSLKVLANDGSNWGIQAFTNEISVNNGSTYNFSITLNSDVAGVDLLLKDDISQTDFETKNLVAGDNVYSGSFVASNDTVKFFYNLCNIPAGSTVSVTAFSLEEVQQATTEPETTTEEPTTVEEFDPSTITDWTLVTNSSNIYYYICDNKADKVSVKPQVQGGSTIYTAYTIAAVFSSVTVNGVAKEPAAGAFYGLSLSDITEAGYYTVTVVDYYGNESVTIVYKVEAEEVTPESTTEPETTTEEPAIETTTEEVTSENEEFDPSTITDWTLVNNSSDVYYYICDNKADKVSVKPLVEGGSTIYTAYTLAATFSSVTVNGKSVEVPAGAFYKINLSELTANSYYTVTVVDHYGNETVTIVYKYVVEETSEDVSDEESSSVEDVALGTPSGLTYAGNESVPHYFAWQTAANAVSYNIYVNDVLVGNTTNKSFSVDASYFETAGDYTIAVSAVNALGVESDKTTYLYTIESEIESTEEPEPETTSEEPTLEEASSESEETTAVTNVEITISDDVKIEGYQISSTKEGSRVIGSVEPTINGQNVVNWGFVYGITEVNGNALDVKDSDMYVGSDNTYVSSLESTSVGTSSAVMGDSSTATYYVRTTLFGAGNTSEFTAKYIVRAYAVLEDGSYVYSETSTYSVFDIAEKLYQNKLMSNNSGHEYLYNNILSVVDTSYKQVDYNWGNSVVKPGDM